MAGFFAEALAAATPEGGWIAYLCLSALVALAITAIVAAVAIFYGVINRAHPELRIQKHRAARPDVTEIRRAPLSIAIISLSFAAGLFIQGHDWARTPLPITPWSTPLMLLGSILAYDCWFYWVHRLLHAKPMLRFHRLHHMSVAPTIWTHHFESLVEALLNQLYYVLIVFVLPIPWPALVLHRIYDQVSGMVGHSGFEHFASPAARAPWPLASTVFHDQHHSHFHYNFAHSFSLWDRLMGTLHPLYDETVAQFEGLAALSGDDPAKSAK